ncbi:MAG: histidine phosphatase family protein [Alphaproteobacteria bacterium]|nr:histidine phosphatase family protein [Alphaproteobacteria bacterium]
MSKVTRWWWIRHAPVPDGGCIYGQRDLSADCTDSAAFAYRAASLPAGAVWVASHLRRTHETAAAICAAGYGEAQPAVERDLAEQHFGEWQGLPRKEVFASQSRWPNFWLAPADQAPPGGESFAQVVARVAPAIERLTTSHAGRNIVAVAHGGTIRAALALALGLTPSAALAFSVDTISLTRLDHIAGPDGAAWRVVAVNQAASALPAGRDIPITFA